MAFFKSLACALGFIASAQAQAGREIECCTPRTRH
jgi:hypothetical protein